MPIETIYILARNNLASLFAQVTDEHEALFNPVFREDIRFRAETNHKWEVRIDFGNDTFRLLGFMDRGNLVILTNGFAKKTEKTPPTKIRLAEQGKHDYESRRNG